MHVTENDDRCRRQRYFGSGDVDSGAIDRVELRGSEGRVYYFRSDQGYVMMTMVSLDTHIHSTTPFCPPPVTTSTIARKPTFAILPEEIIVNILEWCDFKGVLACQRVRAMICS